jgi:2-dehydro-3-deoxyphosphogluconate aldolase/(4S)-4-hydroxy-2-oxoglutarate aldolase
MSRSSVTKLIEQHGVVAVIRLEDAAQLRNVVDALAAGGVQALEVTMTVPNAVELIGRIAPTLPPNVFIGAGTVLDSAVARAAIDAGAQFVVSPVFRPTVIDECHRLDIAAIPGCFTPTEILDAWDAGADIVKIFPATSLGPTFLKDVRAPLPQLRLMPTGGVSLENAGDWLRAGAVAVGVGSALVDREDVTAGNFASITRRAERLIANVRAARGASV